MARREHAAIRQTIRGHALGSSLEHAYRVLVDGDTFRALDLYVINDFPSSIPWNLVATDDGRVLVPDPNGHGDGRRILADPTLVILGDDPDGSGRLDQGIVRQDIIRLDASALRRVCRPGIGWTLERGASGTNWIPGFAGEFATIVRFTRGDDVRSWMVVLDASFRIVTAESIGPTGPSNDTPAEPTSTGGTAYYVPTDLGIVKMVYDPAAGSLERRWTRELPVRGRLGTTPTLLNASDGTRWVVVVDAKVAVVSAINGLIVYDEDERPSTLIAVRRDDDPVEGPLITTLELPAWMGAVENSTAARVDWMVVANYSGYLPNGLAVPAGGVSPPIRPGRPAESPDAEPEFATGVVAVRYDPLTRSFTRAWSRRGLQFSGVPTISDASNLVYGTGAERPSEMTYVYGLRLSPDDGGPGGRTLIREPLGQAPFRTPIEDREGNTIFPLRDYRLDVGEFYDAGNNIIVLEDGSLIVNGGRALARVRTRKP